MFLYLVFVGLGTLFVLFFLVCLQIGNAVKAQCESAKTQYGGDCVEALIFRLNDQEQSFRTRNSTIWALGQIGDERALPVLLTYFNGDIPDRESLSLGISQYELKKAINLASGSLNITAPFWRNELFLGEALK